MDAHIRFEQVCVGYGPRPSLRDISLEIPARQIFGIIGPANSGKTTLLKCINRTISFAPPWLGPQVLLTLLPEPHKIDRSRPHAGSVFPRPLPTE